MRRAAWAIALTTLALACTPPRAAPPRPPPAPAPVDAGVDGPAAPTPPADLRSPPGVGPRGYQLTLTIDPARVRSPSRRAAAPNRARTKRCHRGRSVAPT